jgi:tetratricopeptide (TPR) repeat protein
MPPDPSSLNPGSSPPTIPGDQHATPLARFEAAWEAGGRPRLEDFLAETTEPERPALLRQLLTLEIAARRRLGEEPRSEEYAARLSGLGALIAEVFALFAATRSEAPPAPAPTTHDEPGRGLTDSGDRPATPGAGAPPSPPVLHAGRYEIEEKIGGGGMGEVWRAHDPDLKRPLAVKFLKQEHHGNLPMARRFREEAQLTGQLQHPGIPPVHEVGTLPDGRPFFAMKLIKGRTLAELLKDRPSPQQELPRFLSIFEQVCQTLAYAHSKGVIHRDLKPSNIMVGAFGEVQVMDWGLAKPLASRGLTAPEDDAETSAIATARTVTSQELSQDGDVLGTPAYMAPEQARGKIEALDERSDVFGLGAILCVVMTGAPPYRGTSGEVRARAARGDLTEAQERLAACGADVELLRLAWVCLAPEREARPRDAGVVAQAVGEYLAGVQERARAAERQLAVAQARALEERKRRRLLGLLAAAVLLLGLASWLLYQQRAATLARKEEAGQKALEVLARARVKLEEGWQRHDLARLAEAKAEADQAVEVAHSGDAAPAVRQQVSRFQTEASDRLGRAGKNQQLRDALLNVSASRETARYVSDARGLMTALAEPGVEAQHVEAFRRWDPTLDWTAADKVVARLRQEPEPVLQEIIAALDAWRLTWEMAKRPQVQGRLLRIAAELDQSPMRRQVRALLARKPPPRDVLLAEWTRRSLPWTALCELERGRHWRRLLELRSQVDLTTEPVLSVLLLAQTSWGLGDEAGAEELLDRALIARPGEVRLLTDLGWLLERRKPPRLAEAIACYKAARGLRPGLGVALGLALSRAGQGKEREAVLRELIRQQPKNPEVHVYLGNSLHEQGRSKEAEAAYRQAIRFKPDLPGAHYGLGNSLHAQGQYKEAEAAYRQAIRLKPDFLEAHNNLGNALLNQSRLKEGEAAFRQAIRLKPDSSIAHYNLGNALRDQDRLKEAEAVYRQAIRLQPDDPKAYYNLGIALNAQRQFKEAEDAYRHAIRLQADYPGAHNNLGIALNAQGQYKEAEAAYRQAIRLKPDWPGAHNNLGNALNAQGQYKEAEPAFRQAIRLQPDLPEAYGNLASALHGQGKFREALDSARKAQGLGVGRPGWLTARMAAAIRQLARLVELDEALPAYLTDKRKPSGPSEHIELAALCGHPGKRLYAASARFCAAAFVAQPALADDLSASHRYYAACYAALAGCGRGEDAGPLTDQERARLRKQALDWLGTDLAAWTKRLETTTPQTDAAAVHALTRWQETADLACVRDSAELKKLPEAERAAWRQLWASVAALRRQAEGR